MALHAPPGHKVAWLPSTRGVCTLPKPSGATACVFDESEETIEVRARAAPRSCSQRDQAFRTADSGLLLVHTSEETLARGEARFADRRALRAEGRI